MNSLDFIDKEIEATESAIDVMQEMLDDRVYCYFNKESVLDRLNEGKKRLQTLQQIKEELEAWEVCKTDNSILSVLQTLAKGESVNWHRLPKEKQEILKKALEVNNND